MQPARHLRVVHIASFAALAVWFLSSEALAQTGPADSGQSASIANELKPVIVTAQRRAQRTQDVPITITNISAETLENTHAVLLSDIQSVVPGFRLDDDAGLEQPTIRGVSDSVGCANCGTDVGVYIDGFYDPNGQDLNLPLFNVQSVQVLKGPQGTLFGRNTVGGAVVINTPEPSTTTSGFAQASYGSYNTQQYQAYVTTGLNDKVAVDLGGEVSQSDGWIKNVVTNDPDYGKYQDWLLRLGVKADVTDNMSWLLRFENVSLNNPQAIMFVPYLSSGKPLDYGAYQPGAIVADQPDQIAEGSQYPIVDRTQSQAYQLTGTLNLGFATLKSYTQYRGDRVPTLNGTYSFSYPTLLYLYIPEDQKTITQEFLINSKSSGSLEWTAGVYYYDSTQKYLNIQEAVFGAAPTFLAETGSEDQSISAYGNVTYEVVDNLFLTAGLRYDHDAQVSSFYRLPTSVTVLPTLADNPVMPRAVIRYRLNRSSSAYLSFSRGYKEAIYNTGGFSNVPVRPEELSAFELGYKYAGQKAALDLSSFYYDFTNQQLTSNINVDGAVESVITNAASSHMYGIDADTHYEIFRGLQANVGAEWLHATYATFPDAPAFIVEPDHLLGSVVTNASGDEMARAPEWTLNAGATYTASLAAGVLSLSANVYYTSKFYFDYAQQEPQSQYSTLSLRAAWTSPSDKYVISIAGNNVTNTRYYTTADEDAFGVGAIWGPPAMVVGSIRVNFY